MRLFAAVRPPEHVLDHLASALDLLGAGGPSTEPRGPVRWTPPENWHLTLAFYGEVPDGALPELQDVLAGVGARTVPFELRLRGAGVFSGRTLWVGVAGDVEAMVALCLQARHAGGQVTSREEERVRARPHLTVGRVAPERGRGRRHRRRAAEATPADALVHALAVYEGPGWCVDALELVRSEPGRGRGGGPLYTVLGEHALGAVP